MHVNAVCEMRLEFLFRERLYSMAIADAEAAGQVVSILALKLFHSQQQLRLRHKNTCDADRRWRDGGRNGSTVLCQPVPGELDLRLSRRPARTRGDDRPRTGRFFAAARAVPVDARELALRPGAGHFGRLPDERPNLPGGGRLT